MGLETGTYIDSLDASNPDGANDPKSEGDDHFRLIKATILATFPNLTGAMTATQNALNGAPDTGVKMIFQQTAAPTSWTKDTTHNDKAFRVVSGTASSGGNTAFSTVFARTASDSHTLASGEIPAHDHGSAGAHTHDSLEIEVTAGGASGWEPPTTTRDQASNRSGIIQSSGAHTHSSYGGGGGHTHNMEMRVQYVDTIIATKD